MDDLSSTKVSPSRIGTYADCGEKFRFKYVERRNEERRHSALLFGSVMHAAREIWVLDRSGDFQDLVREAWHTVTKDEPIIAAFLNEYVMMSERVAAALQGVREDWERANPGKVSANPKATKLWREHPVKLELDDLIWSWLPKLSESSYTFSENDPLPTLYNESLSLAVSYQDRWHRLPNAYVSELPFDFEWRGFRLTGYIDSIEPLMERDSGELLGHGIVDAKTYRAEPHQFKDWRQGTMYKLAYLHLHKHGMLPFEPHDKLYFGIDMMRLLDRKFFDLDYRDLERLERELIMYRAGVENEVYVPASKTCMADRCEFAKICSYYHGNAALPVDLNV